MNKTQQEKVKSLGSILSVWAHPDDETFTAAGIMHIAVKNGQRVGCVTATKGEAGSQNEEKWPSKNLAKIREKELYDALRVIGIINHHWLGYKDGYCNTIDKIAAAKKLSLIIEEFKPDSILTFGKDGMTGHSDHCCVSCWVEDAVKLVSIDPIIYHAVHTIDQYENYLKYMDQELNIFFNIDDPPIINKEDCDLYLDLDSSTRNVKLQALSFMPSQTEIMLSKFNENFLSDALSSESFVVSR